MSVQFTAYGTTIRENGTLKIPKGLQFKYGNVSRHEFNARYSPEGHLQRKVSALPTAVLAAAQAIYHLVKAILIGISKILLDNRASPKLPLFYAIRNLQASYGHLTSLFNDRYGQFHVQESQFQQACYDRVTKDYATRKHDLEKKLGSPDFDTCL